MMTTTATEKKDHLNESVYARALYLHCGLISLNSCMDTKDSVDFVFIYHFIECWMQVDTRKGKFVRTASCMVDVWVRRFILSIYSGYFIVERGMLKWENKKSELKDILALRRIPNALMATSIDPIAFLNKWKDSTNLFSFGDNQNGIIFIIIFSRGFSFNFFIEISGASHICLDRILNQQKSVFYLLHCFDIYAQRSQSAWNKLCINWICMLACCNQ